MTLTDIKTKCPGLYCGRQFTDSINGSMSWTECGACPRGYRVNISLSEFSECMPCKSNPTTYDWLYMGFMAMLPLILHWFFIDLAAKERWFVGPTFICHSFSKSKVCLRCSCFVLFFFLVSQRGKSCCMSVHSSKCLSQQLSHC